MHKNTSKGCGTSRSDLYKALNKAKQENLLKSAKTLFFAGCSQGFELIGMFLHIPSRWVKIWRPTENQLSGNPSKAMERGKVKVYNNNGQIHLQTQPQVEHANRLDQQYVML